MKGVRLTAFLLIFCLIFTLCGCRANSADDGSLSGEEAVTQGEKSGKVQLLYNYSDTFNPYTSKTSLNRQLCRLLYDPLVKVNNDYEAVFCIASSIENSQRTCTVRLKGISFSDGSAVTAEDVVYSYKAAAGSATEYASRFYEVASVTASGRDTVVFSLTRPDPYFVNLLDFPIFKSGSDTQVNSDGVARAPVGSGRYTVNEERNRLIVNTGHYEYDGSLCDIDLINAPDETSVSHYVEVGAADIYYTDLSGGEIVRMSGKKTDVNLNSLVFIGINAAYGELSGQYMRYAISSALDRAAVCNQAYYNNAVAATGFFDPAFKAVSSRQTLENKSNLEITVENLEQMGYNRLDKAGYRVNSAGKHPVYTLLVNNDNASRLSAARIIAEQLKAAGLEIRLDERPYDAYKAALDAGAFQLYLGEIKLQNNMDLSQLVLQGGAAAYGVAPLTQPEEEKNENTAENGEAPTGAVPPEQEAAVIPYSEMLARFYSGDDSISIGDIAGALLTEMPQIPVCYRLGLVFYDGDSVSCELACADDIYLAMKHNK